MEQDIKYREQKTTYADRQASVRDYVGTRLGYVDWEHLMRNLDNVDGVAVEAINYILEILDAKPEGWDR